MYKNNPPNTPNQNRSDQWLSRMLAPESIAIIGASPRTGSFGQTVKKLLFDHQFSGKQFHVNPKYSSIDDLPCYPDIKSTPTIPDLAVMVIGSRDMEDCVREAVTLGVGGIVIFANNYLPSDTTSTLLSRLRGIALQADVPICGGNGMGFYNYDTNTLLSFDTPPKRPAGHIAFIGHSGSSMTYFANTDPRFRFNLVVSPGQEIHGTVADYMLYALAQPTTRVIALFLETIRDPETFVRALQMARQKQIPIVAVKIGSTEKSARMAASHSGAIAGNDTAFQAVCDHYGVLRVNDLDELAATALAFSQGRPLGEGGLSSLLDSGGLREQMIDLTENRYISFTDLTEASKLKLGQALEYGLLPENPVDGMGAINADVGESFTQILKALDEDPGTAMLSLEFEFRDDFCQYPQLLEVTRAAIRTTDKPFVVINTTTNVDNTQTATELGNLGIPVINGVSLALTAIENGFKFRDHPNFALPAPIQFNSVDSNRWVEKINHSKQLSEADSLSLLADFGLPVNAFTYCQSLKELLSSASVMEYPLCLKSAQPGLLHKSDVGGVRLSIRNTEELSNAYIDLESRLGPQVLLSPMIEHGIELAFGMINDQQFGPIVMISAGGVLIEIMDDRRFIPAPFSVEEALYNIKALKIAKILKGVRGKPACQLELIAKTLSDFSTIAWHFRDSIDEIDLNPVVATPERCIILDALIIGK